MSEADIAEAPASPADDRAPPAVTPPAAADKAVAKEAAARAKAAAKASALAERAAAKTPAAGEKAHYHGHRERLRQRFLAEPDAMPDYELLELLLCFAIPQRDLKQDAKALIAHFGNYSEVISADPSHLMAQPGIKEAAATMIKVVRESAVRLARKQVVNRQVLTNWTQLLDYCQAAMARAPLEQFRILFLDRQNVLIADEVQQTGTVDHTPVYPREVVKRALDLNASSIIMVHNHPSGDPKPSKVDIEMTKQVREAARAVGVTLHDHLVIGRKGHASFKSMGLL